MGRLADPACCDSRGGFRRQPILNGLPVGEGAEERVEQRTALGPTEQGVVPNHPPRMEPRPTPSLRDDRCHRLTASMQQAAMSIPICDRVARGGGGGSEPLPPESTWRRDPNQTISGRRNRDKAPAQRSKTLAFMDSRPRAARCSSSSDRCPNNPMDVAGPTRRLDSGHVLVKNCAVGQERLRGSRSL